MSAKRDVNAIVRTWLASPNGVLTEPRRGFERLLEMVDATPQRHHWWQPPWATTRSSRGGIIGSTERPRAQRRISSSRWAVGVLAIGIIGIGTFMFATQRTSLRVGGSGSTVVWEPVPLDFPLAPAGTMSANISVLFIDGEFRVLEWPDTVHASVDGLVWRTVSGTRASLRSDWWALRPWASFGGRTIVRYDDLATLLQVREPDGSVVSHQFRGPMAKAVVGPGVILAVEHVMPEDVVQDVLGPEAAADAVIVDAQTFSGSIDVRLKTGEQVHIVLADHGYSTEISWDPYVALLGWRSVDGVEWAPIHDRVFDQGQDLVGSADGFYELAYSTNESEAPRTLSYSADGLAWEELGLLSDADEWLRWDDRLLLPVGGHLMALTPQGPAELPLSAALLGQGGPLADSEPTWVAGELGLVAFAPDQGLVAVSPDGATWSMSELPAVWTTAEQLTLRAVGRNVMLVKVGECRGPDTGDDCFGTDPDVSVLWRGVLQP